MYFKNYINGTYRNTTPDVENGSPSAGGADQPTEPETLEPEAVAEEEPSQPIPEDGNLWDELSNEMDAPDEDEVDDTSEDSPTEEPLDEPEPEAPAEPEEIPETESPAEEPTAADTAVPAEPAEQPTPEPEPIPQRTEQELAEERDARRTQIVDTLTERFAVSEDEALQLVTDPGKIFPQLQARMFADMWLHVEGLIDQRLPSVIERTTQDIKVRDEKVNSFFEVWPKLDRKKHAAQVAQVAKMYAGVNPEASDEDVIRNVGIQVMLMNGMTPDMTPVGNTEEAPPLSEEPQTPPYRPTTVNGANRAPQQSPTNVFEAMSYELDEDED